MVDFGGVGENEDEMWREERRESKTEVGTRICEFLEWLREREEEVVGVVSHSGWLMTLFNGVVETETEALKRWFQTGEMRSVRLVFTKNIRNI
mmetsp:Transcript_32048/g.73724  ORF Transcript_32048/g.73724 Transcript_32048/m.73724 type:complete len:93 (-) Transcript_32048:164-442(-)